MAKKPHAVALRKRGQMRFPTDVAAARKNGVKGGPLKTEAQMLLAEAAELRIRASRLAMKMDLLIIRAELLSARAAALPASAQRLEEQKGVHHIRTGTVTNSRTTFGRRLQKVERRPSAMSKSTESRVAKLRLEIERRQSEARRLTELASNVRARARQLREELAHVRRKVGRG
jgi:chromosome segregation ATPase